MYVAAGVIGDLASTEERGGFYGTANMGPLVSPDAINVYQPMARNNY